MNSAAPLIAVTQAPAAKPTRMATATRAMARERAAIRRVAINARGAANFMAIPRQRKTPPHRGRRRKSLETLKPCGSGGLFDRRFVALGAIRLDAALLVL